MLITALLGFSILQQRKMLLRALDSHKSLLEKATETCELKETELNHLKEKINHNVQQVVLILVQSHS